MKVIDRERENYGGSENVQIILNRVDKVFLALAIAFINSFFKNNLTLKFRKACVILGLSQTGYEAV